MSRGSPTLTVMEGLRRGSIAAASARLFVRPSGELRRRRFKLPSELGVNIPDCGRDASASSTAGEDIND